MCREVCIQNSHAEVDACVKAGNDAKGGTLYLLGHTYCCDNCNRVMKEWGIANIVIGDIPESFKSKIVKQETPKSTLSDEYIEWGIREKYGEAAGDAYSAKCNFA